MGYLAAEDNQAFIVILAEGENLMLEGEANALPEYLPASEKTCKLKP